jgi:hypothetical protein
VNAAGRKLRCECFVNFPGFQEETSENIQGRILELGNQLCLELEPCDVEDLLESHNKEFSTQDLIQLSEFRPSKESTDEENAIEN